MATAAAVTYSIGIPLIVGFDALRSPAAGVLFVLAVYSGIRIAYEIFGGAARWFVLSFWTFSYVFLGVVPLVQINARYFPWAVDTSSQIFLGAAGLCLFGALTFDLGLWVGGVGRRTLATSKAEVPVRLSTDSESHTVRIGRVLLPLLAVSIVSVILLASRGGLGLILASRDEMHAALCPVQFGGGLADCGLVEAFIRVPPALLAVIAFGLVDLRSKPRYGALLLIALIAVLITANPVSAPRFWFGAVGIGLLGVTIGRVPTFRIAAWLLIPALLLVVFPSLDFGRYRNGSVDFSPRLDALIEKQDFDGFQQIANGVSYVDAFGSRNGQQAASSVLFWVPRSIWTDKAPATGPLVTASLGVTSNNNVSAPIWEEAYVDFGVPGVALSFLALGFVIARWEANLQARAGRRSVWLSVAPFLAGYGIFLLRGSLLPAAGFLAVILAMTWLAAIAGRPANPARVAKGREPSH